MKKRLLLIIPMIFALLLVGCTNHEKEISDSERFAKEYTELTTDNYFVYRNSEEIIKILEHGTGVVYLGFPECPWCKAYVPMLNEVADIEGLEKIYYYNILEARKNNTEDYQKMVEILSDYLQYDSEGNTAQGAAKLNGAQFTVKNATGYTITTSDGKTHDDGELITTLTTDANGYAATANDFLPYGEYEVEEIKAPEGYKINAKRNFFIVLYLYILYLFRA